MHEQPRPRDLHGAHEQIAPLGAISGPDSHGHERSFVGGLASDGKVVGSGHSGDEKKGKKGLSGREGEGRKEERERRKIRKKIYFKKNTHKNK